MSRFSFLLSCLLLCSAIGCESGSPPGNKLSDSERSLSASREKEESRPASPTNRERPLAGTIPDATPKTPDRSPTAPSGLPDPATVPYDNPISREEAREGWISLFDRHSFMGWQFSPRPANWSVQDGVITADEGPIDLLCTSVPFADFELDLDFRMEPGGNSGVFLRTSIQPEDVTRDCYEINIADDHPQGFTTGSIVGRKKTSSTAAASGSWKTFHIRCEGRQITVYLDGDLLLEYTDTTDGFLPVGLIGLQKNKGKIEFRNLRLRPLGMQPLFNGEDLAGWRVVPGHKSQFHVVDGTIQVKNGLGFLETEQTWADFIFQAEAQTHAPELNSGFFFRALKIADGENCNGYEAQISNAVIDGDRRRPKDFGTGAIFRRAKARYVVPNDGEWFTTTLIAAGPRISVWVDGYQVVDFTDTRPKNENPRRGRRLKAGHIAIQGHDPSTDLSFRNLRIADLMPSDND